MSFKTHNLISTTSSLYNIELHPDHSYSEAITAKKSKTVSQAGKVENFRVIGGAYRFSLPLSFVNSSDRCVLTRLWLDGSELAYTQNWSTSNAETAFVKIANVNELLQTRTRGEFAYFSGNLNLRSSRSEITGTSTNPVYNNFQINKKVQGSIFTLEDSYLGLLDQTYNPLG